MIAIAPFIYYLLKYIPLYTVNIAPIKLINQFSIHTIPVGFIEAQIPYLFYLFVVYIGGFFAMLSRIFFSYLSAMRQLTGSILYVIEKQPIFFSDHIQSPLSFGFPTAKIYFPSNMQEKWTPREIQMSLAHERIHLEQHDSLWKVLSLFVQALLFFAPWSYLLHKIFELEIEILCDEKTRWVTNASIQEYGNLLIDMNCIQQQNLIFTNITNSTLKGRVLAMKLKTNQRPYLVSMMSIGLLLAGSAAIAISSGVTEMTAFDIKSKIFIDGKLVSSPHIITKDRATIEIGNTERTQSLKIELLAKNAVMSGANDEIKLNYDIQINNNGEKMHFTPSFIVAPYQEGKINISDSGHSYEMHVLAVRK